MLGAIGAALTLMTLGTATMVSMGIEGITLSSLIGEILRSAVISKT
jgi:hypothetical protein